MAAEPLVEARMEYRYLEPKPGKLTNQLGFRDRNMLVWPLIAVMRTEGSTPEEVAKDYDLPLAAVHEAMDYFNRHRDEILAENERLGRRLGLVH